MKEENYIESRKEEIQPRTISFKSSFWLVLAIHLFGGIGIMSLSGGTKPANAVDKKAPEPTQVVETPSPTPIPEPTPEVKKTSQSDFPSSGKPRIVAYPKIGLTQFYVVKKGDTLYAISKKYKLNFEKLKEINNIKDPQKIFVGQKLKFF